MKASYWMVASTIFLGNSSEPTSPPTAKASPPAALISSTTVCAFFSSRLQQYISQSHLKRKNRGILADHDLSSFLSEEESSTPSNTLITQLVNSHNSCGRSENITTCAAPTDVTRNHLVSLCMFTALKVRACDDCHLSVQ